MWCLCHLSVPLCPLVRMNYFTRRDYFQQRRTGSPLLLVLAWALGRCLQPSEPQFPSSPVMWEEVER